MPWLDNGRAIQLRALPTHLVVGGGGYVGSEFAQLYRRLGAAVTMVDPGAHLLGHEDAEVSEGIEGVFSDPALREAWARKERSRFFPYGKPFRQVIARH